MIAERTLEFHEVANIFPLLRGEELASLVEDIRENGLIEPIWLYEEKILDGRNRYTACCEAGVEPVFRQYEGDDPIGFVISLNIERRDLSATVKAIAAYKALPFYEAEAEKRMLAGIRGDPGKIFSQGSDGKSAFLVAKKFHTNGQYVKYVKALAEDSNDIYQRMVDGELTIVEAKKAAKLEDYQIRMKELQVHEGDIWQLGQHFLYCGDNRSETFLGLCRQHEIAFAFADPPYNAGVAEWDKGFVWEHDYLFDLAPMVAVTPGIVSIQSFLCKTSMPYKWMMGGYIDNGMTRGVLGFGNWIPIALFYEELPKQVRNCKDFLQVSISIDERDAFEHKGQKPLTLLSHLVGMFAKESEVVCDPFLGTGTTLIACEQKGRVCVGAESDLETCKSVIVRWEKYTKKEAQVMEW
jgi:hypothetical protein